MMRLLKLIVLEGVACFSERFRAADRAQSSAAAGPSAVSYRSLLRLPEPEIEERFHVDEMIAGEAMAGAVDNHKLDTPACPLEGGGKADGLTDRHDRILGSMQDQEWRRLRMHMGTRTGQGSQFGKGLNPSAEQQVLRHDPPILSQSALLHEGEEVGRTEEVAHRLNAAGLVKMLTDRPL